MELDKHKGDTATTIQRLLTLRERIGDLREELGLSPVQELRMDLLDTGDAYRLVVEVPGIRQPDIEIALEGREVTVAATREPYPSTGHVLSTELPTGHFQRSLTLPGEVIREAANAQLRDGLLILHLPKA